MEGGKKDVNILWGGRFQIYMAYKPLIKHNWEQTIERKWYRKRIWQNTLDSESQYNIDNNFYDASIVLQPTWLVVTLRLGAQRQLNIDVLMILPLKVFFLILFTN